MIASVFGNKIVTPSDYFLFNLASYIFFFQGVDNGGKK